MEFKGTKGKWYITSSPYYNEETGENDGSFYIVTKDLKYIITGVNAYSFWGQTIETAKANALLISKAPEMLEMLIRMTDFTREQVKEEEVLELIKKATEL